MRWEEPEAPAWFNPPPDTEVDPRRYEHRFYLRDTFLEWMQQNERGIRTHYQFIGVCDRILYPHQITFDESTRSYVRIQREEEFFSKHEYDTIIGKLKQRDIEELESMKEELLQLYKADPYFSNSFELIAQHPIYSHCAVEGSLIPFRAYILRYILAYIFDVREMVDSWHLPA
jgi:hypothetical protein